MFHKRLFIWGMPPIVLLATLFALKWKQEHPTPTKVDLAIRRSLVRAQWVQVRCTSARKGNKRIEIVRLDQNQRQLISDGLWMSDGPVKFAGNETLRVAWLARESNSVDLVDININHKVGYYTGLSVNGQTNIYQLRPVSVRSILKTLFSDPQLGPRLRDQLK